MTDAGLTPLQRALLCIRELRGQLEEVQRARTEPIAVTGIGCRLPGGANDPESFWRVLRDGVDTIREMPADRWDVDAWFDPDPEAPGKMTTRWGGFLDGIDQFDPAYFGISPWEAANMDPQQRLMLEVVQEAFDDAGQVRETLRGSQTGVFIGLAHSEYGWLNFSHPRLANIYTATGSFGSIVANRVSYVYDLRGPSYTMDAVCSSSLLAVHQACESLRSGDCTMAVAGGAGLFIKPEGFVWFSKLGVMSADGRCKAFDARGEGIVLGEGVAAVVLKPLSRALADGDPVHALLRGGAVAQDGRSNGLTAPSRLSQEAMLREAYARSGVDPRAVRYVEAHGTGTILGDPIEAQALGAVLGAGRDPGQALRVGSVKTNIGHLQMVGGLAGLIKVVLAMKHRQLPASLHFTEGNPHIPFEQYRIRVQDRLGSWPEQDGPLLAAVTSLSFGGTNVHVIVEEPPTVPPPAPVEADRARLLPLSAHDPAALADLVIAYETYAADPGVDLDDFCYTAAVRRDSRDVRLAVPFTSRADLLDQLAAVRTGHVRPGTSRGDRGDRGTTGRRRLVFVFPGQGGQWPGMGRRLLDQEPVFLQAIEDCAAAMAPHVDWSPLDLLRDGAELDRIDVVQPLTWAVQVALAALWRSWGIQPDAVVGHSMGEVAAAHVAGVLSLADAARIICRRSLLARRVIGRGGMAVVELPLDEARAAIAGYEDRLAIAVSNSPTSTVLSGDTTAIADVLRALDARGVFARLVRVDFASHSPQVDVLRADLLAELAPVRPRPAAVRMNSTVTGRTVAGPELTADYWARNLREPVLFADTVAELLDTGHTVFVEVGPHPILLPAIGQSARHRDVPAVTLPSLRRDEDERAMLLGTFGALWTSGHRVDWRRLHPADRTVLRLPCYPWQRRRCWLDFGPDPAHGGGTVPTDFRVPKSAAPAPAAAPAPVTAPGEAPVTAPGEAGEQQAAEVRAVASRDALLEVPPAGRRDALAGYLRAEIAAVLGLRPTQLDDRQPLPALGLNSLMTFELRNRLKVMYGTQLSTEEFLGGITLARIVDAVLAGPGTNPPPRPRPAPARKDPWKETDRGPASTDPAAWLPRGEPGATAALRLFCLPHAGGSAAIYHAWPDRLRPAGIEVCPVQLPGREQRHHEQPYSRISALVGALAGVLGPYLDRPFALFGHSMGALVAYELARQLRREGRPGPAHLAVSAMRAPQLPDPEPPLHWLPDARLVERLRTINGTPPAMLDDPETLALYLPALRADLALVETYVHASEPPLECPITAFGGDADATVPPDALAAWESRTQAGFALETLPGDHFFVNQSRTELLAALTRSLTGPTES